MSNQRENATSLVLRDDQPLIGLIFEEDGREIVRYFASEEEARRFVSPEVTREALDLIGAWKDLDWEEMEAALNRIRHG
jgi:hypothetical protein